MLKYLNEFYNLIRYFLQPRIFNLRYVWKNKRYKDLGNILQSDADSNICI